MELEEMCGVHCIKSILAGKEMWEKEMKEMLRGVDCEQHMARCREKAPLIVRVEAVVGWRRLWGNFLISEAGVQGLKVLSRLLGHHGKEKKPCPCCDVMDLPVSVLTHILIEAGASISYLAFQ
jgi:hypothetical protein